MTTVKDILCDLKQYIMVFCSTQQQQRPKRVSILSCSHVYAVYVQLWKFYIIVLKWECVTMTVMSLSIMVLFILGNFLAGYHFSLINKLYSICINDKF
jgi:hypothetical protein